MLSPRTSQNVAIDIKEHYGLNQPVIIQYARWMKNWITGDLGISISYGMPVLDIIRDVLPNTLVLSTVAIILELIIGIGLGLISHRYYNTLFDRIISHGALLLFTTPTFWVGIVLVPVFSYTLGIF